NSTGTGGFNALNTIMVHPGAGLILDNTTVNNNNRLPDVFSILNGSGDAASGSMRLVGGSFTVRGNAGGTSEQTNRFELTVGTVTLENNGGNVTLTTGRMNRTVSNAIGLVRGTNLGLTPGPTTTNWFAVDMGSGSTQLGGAGGAAGTPFVNIIPGMMADRSATGVGTDLTTYD